MSFTIFVCVCVCERERERERSYDKFIKLKMFVYNKSQIFSLCRNMLWLITQTQSRKKNYITTV